MRPKRNYGSRGQKWHPAFVEYMGFIAHHPNYAGMPDAFVGDNKIQWEAPSNRSSGRFKDTHHKRRDWWRQKARQLGISTASEQWISKTAKRLHPTGKKPCKRCGRCMEIRYVYPRRLLFDRLGKLKYYEPSFELDRLESIPQLIGRLYGRYGKKIFGDLPLVLKTSAVTIPSTLKSLEHWQEWIESTYVPSEPPLLSPGAMSNAPDRFDGFHSFNLCCRGTADTGRRRENLAAYVTDRRVFEYWADGDWIAADRLIGQVRTRLRNEPCRHGHSGPCDADHIGPISLGFSHHPEFQLLCKACNSAKNNRMNFADVRHLLKMERNGVPVISWQSKALWDLRKTSVRDDETALRISKLLRDNRHSFMAILREIERRGFYSFLLSLLNLECADYNVEFEDLKVMDGVTHLSAERRTRRTTKYAIEQKARRCRVALQTLRSYFKKGNRNAFVVMTDESAAAVNAVIVTLGEQPPQFTKLDKQVARLIRSRSPKAVDLGFRRALRRLPSSEPAQFRVAKKYLSIALAAIARELSKKWDDERYVRAENAIN